MRLAQPQRETTSYNEEEQAALFLPNGRRGRQESRGTTPLHGRNPRPWRLALTAPTLSPDRVDRITGSRVAAVLGLSPYTNRRAVMREMVRQHFGAEDEFMDNPIVRWGREHEVDAMEAYIAYQDIEESEIHGSQDFVVHPEFSFLGVTPDGLVDEDGLIEIKCPWRASYSHIADRLDYLEQIQLQLACTGRDWAHFVVWRPEEPVNVSTVFADPDWLPDRLGKLVEFMDEFAEIIADPALAAPHLEPLVDVRYDEDWQVAAYDYLEEAANSTRAQLRESAARQRLVDLAGVKSAKGFGVTVSRSERRGNVDWQEFKKKYQPDTDVEEFRKAPSIVYTVRPWATEKEYS